MPEKEICIPIMRKGEKWKQKNFNETERLREIKFLQIERNVNKVRKRRMIERGRESEREREIKIKKEERNSETKFYWLFFKFL